MSKLSLVAAAALLAATAAAPTAALAGNILETHIASVLVSGTPGVLRAGSIWAPAPPAAALSTLFDGVFRPINTTWTSGTFWWDELAFATAANPVSIEVQLTSALELERFVVQGDDNESYHVDWWDGLAWQLAYTAAPVFTFGMETRDSGIQASITTDRLRIRATGGDAYYSLSEVQAYAVPLPSTLALIGLAGLALMGTRRRPAPTLA